MPRRASKSALCGHQPTLKMGQFLSRSTVVLTCATAIVTAVSYVAYKKFSTAPKPTPQLPPTASQHHARIAAKFDKCTIRLSCYVLKSALRRRWINGSNHYGGLNFLEVEKCKDIIKLMLRIIDAYPTRISCKFAITADTTLQTTLQQHDDDTRFTALCDLENQISDLYQYIVIPP